MFTGCIIAHTDYRVTADYAVILSAEGGGGVQSSTGKKGKKVPR
jgi:hypothetical protein